MQKLKLIVLVSLFLSVMVFASAGIFDFLTNDDREVNLSIEAKQGWELKGVDSRNPINSTQIIDWPKESAQICLAHPTDSNFNLPCLEIETYWQNCTVYEINFYNESEVIFFEDESNETIITLLNETTEKCISFEKINKTTEVIINELEEKVDKKIEQLGRVFNKRSQTSNPEIISEGTITIK